MPGKQHLALNSFHQGLNSKTDPRDIADSELALCENISVDEVGRLTMSGNRVEQASSNLALSLSDGYSLFRFSSDFAGNGTTTQSTDYLIAWDDAEGKLYWLPNLDTSGSANTAWANETHLDLSSDWGTGETVLPTFYYVDGALRISDGSFAAAGNVNNPSQWIGTINRTLFPGGYQGGNCVIGGWYKQKQELLTPTVGKVSSTAASSASDVQTDGVYWHLRNLRENTDSVYTFSVASTTPGIPGSYTQSEQISNSDGGEGQGDSIVDEQWMTVQKGTDGYATSNYHDFGVALHGEDDDEGETYVWTIASPFNTGNSGVSFGSGQSLYLAVRMAGEEQKQMWNGTHAKSLSGESSISITVSDGYITFNENSGTDFIKFHFDRTKFTDVTTPSAQWHILEFPYDEAFETDISGTFQPEKIKLELNVTWTRTGNVYSNGTSSGTSAPYTYYKDIPGWSLIQLSDLRVGDTDLVGVTTYGKQKFLMSNTYDDTESESLLYDFGGGSSQEVVLDNTTSTYKIGISAYVKVPSNSFNKRISGANLYIEDDGIPYRIAQLRYMKGLKGAWEAEYPKADSDKFAESVGSNEVNVTSTVKTDGLPLLESYEAMNGFSPSVSTITALYKTAVVLNRKTYIGNIYQDGKQYSDRMIKSNANSFDVFPSEGKYIDVVQSDGDSIVKLEAYADRILQFKKEVMYLINATRDSEYLEDTFIGKGIASPSASTKTDVGIAWANENGAYLYDGERVHNLTEGKIKDSDWETFAGTSTDVTYVPLKNKLIISGGTNGVDVFEYTFFTKSWSKSTSKLHSSKTNFIIDGNKAKYVASDGEIYYWDDSSSSSDSVRILTKDFTFGNPASRKKCFKFYVTYKCTGASNLKVYYGTNGQDLTLANATGEEVSTSSKFAGTSSSCYGSDGLVTTSGEWKQAELTPSSSINNVYSVQLHFKSSNLVTNGTFDTNTTGWSALRSTLSVNSQKLRITSDSSSGNAIGVSDFTAVVGAKYRLKADFISGTDQGAKVSVGKTDALSTGTYQGGTGTMTADTSVNFTFTAVATTQRIYLYQVETDDADGDYHEWDNIVVSPEVPSDFEINDMTVVYREKPMK